MNLIFLLLSTRQFLSKDQIREAIADYRADGDVAFNRKFERDKEELRELGIPVETGTHSQFGDEPGYRIPRESAELPELDLTPEESAVIGLATQVWEHAGLAGQSSAALLKLKAAGVDVDTSAVRMAEPRLSAEEPAFDAMWEAVTGRSEVQFAYAKAGEPSTTRRVQPWGILSWRGRWYMGGFDLDREAPRLFRLSRVEGEVRTVGARGGYEIPEDVTMQDLARSLFPPEPVGEAVLHVQRDRAVALRRSAVSVTRLDDRTDEVVVRYASPWQVAAEAASYGPDVVVHSPPEARQLTATLLRSALDAATLDPAS